MLLLLKISTIAFNDLVVDLVIVLAAAAAVQVVVVITFQ